jgi:ABC-type multidrug transport system fused ATPase/permease subunit
MIMESFTIPSEGSRCDVKEPFIKKFSRSSKSSEVKSNRPNGPIRATSTIDEDFELKGESVFDRFLISCIYIFNYQTILAFVLTYLIVIQTGLYCYLLDIHHVLSICIFAGIFLQILYCISIICNYLKLLYSSVYELYEQLRVLTPEVRKLIHNNADAGTTARDLSATCQQWTLIARNVNNLVSRANGAFDTMESFTASIKLQVLSSMTQTGTTPVSQTVNRIVGFFVALTTSMFASSTKDALFIFSTYVATVGSTALISILMRSFTNILEGFKELEQIEMEEIVDSKEKEIFEMQAFSDKQEIEPTNVRYGVVLYKAMYTMTASMFGLSTERMSKQDVQDLTVVSKLMSTFKQTVDLATLTTTFAKWITNDLHLRVYGTPMFGSLPTLLAENIETWHQEVGRMILTYTDIDCLKKDAVCKKFVDTYKEGLTFTTDLEKHSVNPKRFTLYMADMKYLKDMIDGFKNKGAGAYGRIPPVVIWLYGEAGCGKSTLADFLARTFALNISKSDWKNDIYSMNLSDKYLSGYNGQSVFFWDDPTQANNTELTNDFAALFFQITGSLPFHPNMAAINQKGCIKFDSKFIIITTNEPPNRRFNIEKIEALLRRIDVLANVETGLVINTRDHNGFMGISTLDNEFSLDVYHVKHVNSMNTQEILGVYKGPDFVNHVFDICKQIRGGRRDPMRKMDQFTIKDYEDKFKEIDYKVLREALDFQVGSEDEDDQNELYKYAQFIEGEKFSDVKQVAIIEDVTGKFEEVKDQVEEKVGQPIGRIDVNEKLENIKNSVKSKIDQAKEKVNEFRVSFSTPKPPSLEDKKDEDLGYRRYIPSWLRGTAEPVPKPVIPAHLRYERDDYEAMQDIYITKKDFRQRFLEKYAHYPYTREMVLRDIIKRRTRNIRLSNNDMMLGMLEEMYREVVEENMKCKLDRDKMTRLEKLHDEFLAECYTTITDVISTIEDCKRGEHYRVKMLPFNVLEAADTYNDDGYIRLDDMNDINYYRKTEPENWRKIVQEARDETLKFYKIFTAKSYPHLKHGNKETIEKAVDHFIMDLALCSSWDRSRIARQQEMTYLFHDYDILWELNSPFWLQNGPLNCDTDILFRLRNFQSKIRVRDLVKEEGLTLTEARLLLQRINFDPNLWYTLTSPGSYGKHPYAKESIHLYYYRDALNQHKRDFTIDMDIQSSIEDVFKPKEQMDEWYESRGNLLRDIVKSELYKDVYKEYGVDPIFNMATEKGFASFNEQDQKLFYNRFIEPNASFLEKFSNVETWIDINDINRNEHKEIIVILTSIYLKKRLRELWGNPECADGLADSRHMIGFMAMTSTLLTWDLMLGPLQGMRQVLNYGKHRAKYYMGKEEARVGDSKLKDVMVAMVALGSAISIGYGAWKTYKYFCPDEVEKVEDELQLQTGVYSHRATRAKEHRSAPKKKGKQSKISTSRNAKSEWKGKYQANMINQSNSDFEFQVSDPNCEAVIDARVVKNIAVIYYTAMIKGQKCFQGWYVTFINSQHAITTRHAFILAEDDRDCIVTIKTSKEKFDMKYKDMDILFDEENDLGMIKLPRAAQDIKRLDHMFIKENKVKMRYTEAVTLVKWYPIKKSYALKTMPMATLMNPECHRDVEGRQHRVKESIMGNITTYAGDCGLPYVVYDPYSAEKLIGIHIAKSKNTGKAVCAVTTQEYVTEFMEKFLEMEPQSNFIMKYIPETIEKFVTYGEDIDFGNYDVTQLTSVERLKLVYGIQNPFKEEVPDIFDHDNVVYVGKVGKEWGVSRPMKSCFRKSTLHGVMYEPEKAPAKLRATEELDPMIEGLKKYKRKMVRRAKNKEIERMVVILQHKFAGIVPESAESQMSLLEALNGFNHPRMGKVKINKSAGFPWTKMPGISHTGKHGIIEPEADDDGHNVTYQPTEKLQVEIVKYLMALENGDPVDSFFTDTLKDELLSMAKVLSGRTRVFSIADAVHLIACRMFFGSFVDSFMNTYNKHPGKVGINPNGPDWAELYNELHKFDLDPIIGAGDFTNFDASEPPPAVYAAALFINWWYKRWAPDWKPEHDKIRLQHIIRIIYTLHICGHDVFYTLGSMPSGCFLTTILNCLVNIIVLYTSIFSFAPPNISRMEILEKIVMAVFGDDNLISCISKWDWFSVDKLRNALKDLYNMTYTNFDKSEMKVGQTHTMEEVTFLKRFFLPNGPYVFAPLEKKVLRNMTQWIRKSPDLDADTMTRDNCEVMLREYFHWGKQEFDHVKSLLNNALMDAGIPPIELNWNMLYCDYTEGSFTIDTYRLVMQAGWDDDVWDFQSGNEMSDANQGVDETEVTNVQLTSFEEDVGTEGGSTVRDASFYENLQAYPIRKFDNQLHRTTKFEATFEPGFVTNDIILDLELPYDILNKTSTLLSQLIEHYNWFNGKLRLKIMVNGNNFTNGWAILGYLPYYDPANDLSNNQMQNIWNLSVNRSLVLPVNGSSTYEYDLPVVIPFRSLRTNSWDSQTNRNAIGHLRILVGAPLWSVVEGATVDPISITVFCYWTHVFATGPNDEKNITPRLRHLTLYERKKRGQVGYYTDEEIEIRKKEGRSFEKNKDEWILNNAQIRMRRRVQKQVMRFIIQEWKEQRAREQIGVRITSEGEVAVRHVKDDIYEFQAFKNPVPSEVKQTDGGALSSALQTTSEVAAIATTIPEIGGIAQGVSKVAAIGAKVASSLGYSRPVAQSDVNPMLMETTGDVATGVRRNIHLANLTMDPNNAITALNVTEHDFNKFNDYVRMPSLLYHANIGVADNTVGTIVFGPRRLTPTMCYHVSQGPGNPYLFYRGPMCNLSSMFELSTGIIRLQFMFLCPQVLSGRIGFAYFPRRGSIPTGATIYDKSSEVFSKIVNINGNTSFMMNFPFGTDQMMARHYPADMVDDTSAYSDTEVPPGNIWGTLAGFMVQPFSSSFALTNMRVQMLVFVSGIDFHFTVPRNIWPGFYYIATAPSTSEKVTRKKELDLEPSEHVIEAAAKVIAKRLVKLRGFKGMATTAYNMAIADEVNKLDILYMQSADILPTDTVVESGNCPFHIFDFHMNQTGEYMNPMWKQPVCFGFTHGEEVGSFKELVKRFSYADNTLLGNTSAKWLEPVDQADFSADGRCLLHNVIESFHFWRGSREYMFILKSGDMTDVALVKASAIMYPIPVHDVTGGLINDDPTSDFFGAAWGIKWQTNQMRPSITIRIPYSSQMLFKDQLSTCLPDTAYLRGIVGAVGTNKTYNVYAAGGDDFEIGYPICPRMMAYDAPPLKRGDSQRVD